MKHLLLVLLLFILSLSSQAQQNLVPNPSFEDTVYCPWGTNQLDACANWLNFGNSPDYFNTCTGFGGPPFNYGFGDQNTHSGNAMAGISLYRRPNSPSGPNYREIIGVEFGQPLIIGQKYFFSCYANFAGNPLNAVACNKLGVNFYTQPYDSCCLPPINNYAKIYADSILTDSVSWFRLEGSFIADSAYSFLGIGNFFLDTFTDTIRIGAFPDGSYYYIDDVCLTTDSTYNQNWTFLSSNYSEEHFNLWPNPTKSSFYINRCLISDEINLKDLFGQNISYDITCVNDEIVRLTPRNINSFTILVLRIRFHSHFSQSFRIIFQP